MFSTVVGWYDAAWAWLDAVIGPILLYGFLAVILIGGPIGIWTSLTFHRKGIPMKAKIVEHLRDSAAPRERTPVYELMPDPKIALLSQYAGRQVKGSVSSGLSLRDIGMVVDVHYVPETNEIMSMKDQMLTPIVLAFFWVVSAVFAYGHFIDEGIWDFIFSVF